MQDKKIVVLNAGKMNFDSSMDFNQLSKNVSVYSDTPSELILERINGADAIITKELVLSADLVEKFPSSIKLIVEAGTGYNNIPIQALQKKGISLCNIPAYSTQRVAQTAIMLMLNMASSMGSQIRMLQRGDHSNFTEHLQVPHFELNDKTLGIIGYGNTGKEVIKVAKAMGMNILVHTRTPKDDISDIKFVSLDELLEKSDFVSLHCPLNENTRHIINKGNIAKMKKSSFLINTARGALVDEKALVEALNNKLISGAGLDVQEIEPPQPNNPLYDMENVILTPHMGWKGFETRQRLLSIIKDDIDAFFKGSPINKII